MILYVRKMVSLIKLEHDICPQRSWITIRVDYMVMVLNKHTAYNYREDQKIGGSHTPETERKWHTAHPINTR